MFNPSILTFGKGTESVDINIDMRNLSAGRCRITILGGVRSMTYEFIHGTHCNERINIAELPTGKYYFVIDDEEGWRETCK